MSDPPPEAYDSLTRDNVAVIFIDLQVGPLSTIRTIDQQELKQNAIALATVAQMFDLPTFFAMGSQTGPGAAFLPELLQTRPEHTLVKHSRANVWETPELPATLKQTGRKKLIMAGIAAEIGLLFPVLSAIAAGYNVYVATDVCGTITARGEQAAFTRMTQAGAIMSSWASLAVEILKDFSAEHGRDVLGLINKQLLEDRDA
ncbi:MAG TPA: isochorismatase family protein [Ktedonobacteraceae bacterium]|nr:isochorismatase family protein [Ktedonobacteraceae bacterium]